MSARNVTQTGLYFTPSTRSVKRKRRGRESSSGDGKEVLVQIYQKRINFLFRLKKSLQGLFISFVCFTGLTKIKDFSECGIYWD
jgi:hypothetical protein